MEKPEYDTSHFEKRRILGCYKDHCRFLEEEAVVVAAMAHSF